MFTWWEKLIAVVGTVLILWLAVVLAQDDIRKKREFMAECRTEKKQYECDAMWRAGKSHAYPVIVPIHTRR